MFCKGFISLPFDINTQTILDVCQLLDVFIICSMKGVHLHIFNQGSKSFKMKVMVTMSQTVNLKQVRYLFSDVLENSMHMILIYLIEILKNAK